MLISYASCGGGGSSGGGVGAGASGAAGASSPITISLRAAADAAAAAASGAATSLAGPPTPDALAHADAQMVQMHIVTPSSFLLRRENASLAALVSQATQRHTRHAAPRHTRHATPRHTAPHLAAPHRRGLC